MSTSRLSHDSVFDAWLIQLREVLALRVLDQFIDRAPVRKQGNHVEGDERALAILPVAVDETTSTDSMLLRATQDCAITVVHALLILRGNFVGIQSTADEIFRAPGAIERSLIHSMISLSSSLSRDFDWVAAARCPAQIQPSSTRRLGHTWKHYLEYSCIQCHHCDVNGSEQIHSY
jgi:hypothetical protein